MKVKTAVPVVLLLSALAIGAYAVDDKKEAPSVKHPGLDKFKQLAGEWEGKEVEGLQDAKEIRVNYKVTAGGSAVVETLFPGTEHEMVTVIHTDGDDLVLTHYCMLGNQPHMKVDGKTKLSDTFAFKFTGASNLKSDKDMHMHDATYTFVDKDTLKTEWTHYMNGKPGGKVVFELKRKK